VLTEPVSVAGERGSPQASVMNFLNEVAAEFPDAIPLAAGRPNHRFLERLGPQALAQALTRYLYMNGPHGTNAVAGLLQYGRTAGVIGDLVAYQLRIDAGVPARSERILVTTGSQEGIHLCLTALCPAPQDVLLVCNPTYIGATGAAQAAGIRVFALPDQGPLAVAVETAVIRLKDKGCQPRALYLIPDFDNPTGRVLDTIERHALITTCARHGIAILEDGVYRLFRYDGAPVPSMAQLDQSGCVIHLASYAKTLAPGLRMGAIALPETWFGSTGARQALYQDISQRKSFLTVNTSPITQAIVGGILLEQHGTLLNWIQPAIDFYRRNRDTVVTELRAAFAPQNANIYWNRPEGGFFLQLDLPFRFDAAAVRDCATRFGVIAMPMAFFALDGSQDRRIRLSFSAVDPERLRAGVTALRNYVVHRIAQGEPQGDIHRTPGTPPCWAH
jgi:(S)-3,5-dihydroxyphenylglycine transaminase